MDITSERSEAVVSRLASFDAAQGWPDVPVSEVKKNTDVMIWSMRLCSIRRYFHQRFWETETVEAEYAARIESSPRLESVADHSWHVCDTVLLIAPSYDLDLSTCLKLAVLHDKMEISTGDKSPIGRSGTGSSTHAFNESQRLRKEDLEREAISAYIASLSQSARRVQEPILLELLEGVTDESRFVKAIDKLQPLAFVISKKQGTMVDKHVKFTLRYSAKAIDYYPSLSPYYQELRSRLLQAVAKARKQTVPQLESFLDSVQLSLLDEL